MNCKNKQVSKRRPSEKSRLTPITDFDSCERCAMVVKQRCICKKKFLFIITVKSYAKSCREKERTRHLDQPKTTFLRSYYL